MHIDCIIAYFSFVRIIHCDLQKLNERKKRNEGYAMIKKTAALFFFLLTLTLFTIQGYFALHKDFNLELRAQRNGAKLIERSRLTAEAGQALRGMTVYLTFETEDNIPSMGTVTINGRDSGSLQRGILTLSLTENDILAVKNAVGETIHITDPPEGLDTNALPLTLFCDQTVTKWGKISFK